MRTRHLPIVLVFMVVILIPSIASADGHRAGLFGGISFARGSVLTGAHFNYERTWVEKDEKYIYVAGDYSFHTGDDITRQIAMIGVTPSFRFGPLSGGGRFLIGSVWGDGSSNLAGVVGGFVDIAGYPASVHSTKTRVEVRITVEEVLRSGSPENFERYSIGLVVKWPR